ncbi:MAG: hypothetical protein QXU69_08955 [Thermofilaceae archaeon]
MVKVIELDMEKLYDIGSPEESAWKLLMKILEYYDIADKVVLLINDSPDIGREIIINKLNINEDMLNSEEYAHLDEAEEVKKLESAVVVRFNDGYELAQAVLVVEEDC